MGAGIRGSRRHVAKQQHEDDGPDRSQVPPEESVDEVATRIRKEVGEAGRRLRRDAVRFEKGPPPDQGNEDGARHV
ncbi:hypothetical protein EDD98_4648 [Streptomyces sp. PanSC19]|uniref:Uncharacterized protein n=1 Tax=Streptomyces litmocidini TaxID=67318 RepID=A0ABW7U514_9ACTN|nr:hypothetical protein [Streptomyces sp. PanSC19]ROQ35579.1 hypothetical protein EDD98_4648 [Streptomyces sp. PanSC19]